MKVCVLSLVVVLSLQNNTPPGLTPLRKDTYRGVVSQPAHLSNTPPPPPTAGRGGTPQEEKGERAAEEERGIFPFWPLLPLSPLPPTSFWISV